MSRNGTPAIILIYLIITLPLLVDKRGVQRFVDASSVSTSPEINLFETFKDRLNESLNFAQSRYEDNTSETIKQIYDLAAIMLNEALQQKQAQPAEDASSDNYADEMVDEANPPNSEEISPPADDAASGAAETAVGAAKKNSESINAANTEKLDHRKRRRARKSSQCRVSRPSYGSRKSQPIRSGKHHHWEIKGIQPVGLRAKHPATSSMVSHKSNHWPWQTESENVANAPSWGEMNTDPSRGEMNTDASRGEMNTDPSREEMNTDPSQEEMNTAPGQQGEMNTDPSRDEMNWLAGGIDAGMNQQHRLPSVKWQKKSKFGGKGGDLQIVSFLPSFERLNEQPDDIIDAGMNQHRLPSVKWQKKSKFGGKGGDLQKINLLPDFGHSNEQPDDQIDAEMNQYRLPSGNWQKESKIGGKGSDFQKISLLPDFRHSNVQPDDQIDAEINQYRLPSGNWQKESKIGGKGSDFQKISLLPDFLHSNDDQIDAEINQQRLPSIKSQEESQIGDKGSDLQKTSLLPDFEHSNEQPDDRINAGINQYRLPSAKWQKKSKIGGKGSDLQHFSLLPGFGRLNEQPDDLIESLDVDDDKLWRESRFAGNKRGSRLSARSTDQFPEVFSMPAVGSPSLPVIETGNGLDEAIRKANFLLSSASATGSDLQVPNPGISENIRRISKELGPLNSLPGPGPGPTTSQSNDNNNSNLTSVMEKVLVELRSLKECKEEGNALPEGSPCDVVGTWNSETIGLQFHISLAEPGTAQSRAFIEGKKLEIEIKERVTPRQHDLMDCDWYVTGRTLKLYGGPLIISAQKTEQSTVATFAGLCKNCGSVPTIFGAWTFVYPAKDCQDVSLAIETKRDVFRKSTLEAKRKHRLENKGAGKCSRCSLY